MCVYKSVNKSFKFAILSGSFLFNIKEILIIY